jgi:hypothetical protein
MPINRKKQYSIANLISQPVYLYSFQTLREQLKLVFPTGQYQLIDIKKKPYRFNYGIYMVDRLSLLKTGRLCSLLIQKLLYMKNQPPIRNQSRLGIAISSRHNYFDKVNPECVAEIKIQSNRIQSIAFHPTKPLILTSSGEDKTAKLWKMKSNYEVKCLVTLVGLVNS